MWAFTVVRHHINYVGITLEPFTVVELILSFIVCTLYKPAVHCQRSVKVAVFTVLNVGVFNRIWNNVHLWMLISDFFLLRMYEQLWGKKVYMKKCQYCILGWEHRYSGEFNTPIVWVWPKELDGTGWWCCHRVGAVSHCGQSSWWLGGRVPRPPMLPGVHGPSLNTSHPTTW